MTQKHGNLRPRVLSGMRPTGKLHLGNYVGALQNWIKLQDTHNCFFFIADWHALTTDYDDTSRLAATTIDVLLDWLGAGLDPEKCTMFVQSHVKQHAELHLLFSMVTPLGWLERVPTYKEQQQNLATKDLSTYGFLGYPLLQAADILIYQADFVPVGEDQVAHVELTREVARRFNNFFPSSGPGSNIAFTWGDAQPIPASVMAEPLLKEPHVLLTKTPKLLGTDKRKMSKSYGNAIFLSEEASSLAEKINNSVTDRPKLTDKGSPDRCPVGNLHQIFSDAERLAYITRGCTQATITCVECKALAVESTEAHLKPIRERRRELSQNRARLIEIVRNGAENAIRVAEETMSSVRSAIGLTQFVSISGKSTGLGTTTGTLRDANAFSPIMDPGIATSVAAADDSDDRLFLPTEQLTGLSHTERGDRRRDLWLTRVKRTYSLRDVGHRTFVTGRNRRIGIPTSGEHAGNRWLFSIGDRTYDALVLLCHSESGEIIDFIIPRRLLKGWELFRREGKNVVFEVQETPTGSFFLRGSPDSPQSITEFRKNYSVLQ